MWKWTECPSRDGEIKKKKIEHSQALKENKADRIPWLSLEDTVLSETGLPKKKK